MGSSSRANGGVRAQFSTAANILFSQFTIRGLAELDELTRGVVGYRPIGYLLMAGDEARGRWLRRSFELQRSLGVPVEWVSRDRVRELIPFARVDDLDAATFCASDGVIDPHGVITALHDEGRRLGATYLFDTMVEEVEHDGTRATIRCTRAAIESDVVVNAAGPFASQVAATAGVSLPVLPYRRNLACTEPVEDLPQSFPMAVDLDTGVLIRREGPGLLICYSDPADAPTFETSFDAGFLEAVASRIGHRFPAFEGVTINPRKCWAGLYPETPDHHAIIDAPADAPWFIQSAGFGGHGIMHSLAAGQAVAELISQRRCTTFDLAPFRLDRFGDANLTVETAVL